MNEFDVLSSAEISAVEKQARAERAAFTIALLLRVFAALRKLFIPAPADGLLIRSGHGGAKA